MKVEYVYIGIWKVYLKKYSDNFIWVLNADLLFIKMYHIDLVLEGRFLFIILFQIAIQFLILTWFDTGFEKLDNKNENKDFGAYLQGVPFSDKEFVALSEGEGD
jgi:hypothetical protein